MTTELVFTATYNERENIEWWTRQVGIHQPGADILVVDDNSPDGTAAIVSGLVDELPQVRLHVRAGKLGLASAHLFAMRYALDHGYDRLVTLDADGSHQPSQISRLLEAGEHGDFVIGTRTRGGSHQATLPRQVLSKGANATARLLLPMGLSEYTTSFRVFSPRALEVLVLSSHDQAGYSFFIECLEILHRSGVSMTERPIDFLDRAGGTSKIPRNQIYLSMRTLARLGWRRRVPTSSATTWS